MESFNALKSAFGEWEKNKKEDEVEEIKKQITSLRNKQIERLKKLKKAEEDEVKKLKNRLKKIQSGDDSTEIRDGDEWEKLKRSRLYAVKAIQAKQAKQETITGTDTSTSNVKLKLEDNNLLKDILKMSYDFVEEKVDFQRSEIQQILQMNDKQNGDMNNGSKEKPVLSAEIQEMQKVLNYRTAQDFCDFFSKENWKNIHSKYRKQCSYLEMEFEENAPGLKQYTEACLKISCSMCTEIPRRIFCWKITTKNFIRVTGAVLNETDNANLASSRLILPAIISIDNENHVFTKGTVQLNSASAADTDNIGISTHSDNTDNTEIKKKKKNQVPVENPASEKAQVHKQTPKSEKDQKSNTAENNLNF